MVNNKKIPARVFTELHLETYWDVPCASVKTYMVNKSLSCTSNLGAELL